jgi:hypothetical protein
MSGIVYTRSAGTETETHVRVARSRTRSDVGAVEPRTTMDARPGVVELMLPGPSQNCRSAPARGTGESIKFTTDSPFRTIEYVPYAGDPMVPDVATTSVVADAEARSVDVLVALSVNASRTWTVEPAVNAPSRTPSPSGPKDVCETDDPSTLAPETSYDGSHVYLTTRYAE